MFALSLYRGFYGFLALLIILSFLVFFFLRRREARELARMTQVKLDEEEASPRLHGLPMRNDPDGFEVAR